MSPPVQISPGDQKDLGVREQTSFENTGGQGGKTKKHRGHRDCVVKSRNWLTLTSLHSCRQSGIANFPHVIKEAPPVTAVPFFFPFFHLIKRPHATRWPRQRSRRTHRPTGRQVTPRRGHHVATATITPCLFDSAAVSCARGGHAGCFWVPVLLRPQADQFSNAQQPPSSLTLDPRGA